MFKYVPALSGPWIILPNMIRNEFKFWDERAIVSTESVLISYGIKFSMKSGIFDNISEYYSINLSKTLTIADSGGYEVYTHNVTIPVHNVIDWQFRNANIILVLDMPPRGMSKLESVSDWHKCMEYTFKNTNELIKYTSSRKYENKKIYGVVHGISLGELNEWYDKVIKPFEGVLDGLSYAVRPPNNPKAVMLALTHAKMKGVKNLHILGITGMRTLIPMVYVGNDFNILTTDSASFTKIVGRGRVITPVFLTYVKVGTKGRALVNYSVLECSCPACTYARKYTITNPFTLDNGIKYILASLHNLFWIKSYINALEWLKAYSIKNYHEYAKTRKVDLSWFKCVDEEGIDYCYVRYMYEFEEKAIVKYKSSKRFWW